LASAPTFTWTPDGGTDNRYVVDFQVPGQILLWTTSILSDANWAMPQSIWDFISFDTQVLWRVRGADLGDPPLDIITSDEVWSFVKKEEVVGWSKTFGGAKDDVAKSVQQTTDGGYIVAGWTWSYGAGYYDFWLIKTDADGNKLWDQTYGGINYEGAFSVQQTTDGGYIAAGHTASDGVNSGKAWLVKTDADGNKLWDQTYAGVGREGVYSVQQTTDGGYILAGQTGPYMADSDFWLIKTDADGNRLWARTYGGTKHDGAHSVQQTTDGGYIAAGVTKSYGAGSSDAWLIKVDADGNKIWDQTYGGTNGEWAHSVQQTTDGGYIVAGWAFSPGAGFYDFWLIKTDAEGNKLWDQTYGGAGQEWANSVQQTTDGGYIIAGFREFSQGRARDFWLVKTDADGNKMWDRAYGGTERQEAHSVQQTTDGGYIVAGTTESYDPAGVGNDDVWLIKTDENGNVTLP
jgi:hypothetical protein